MKIFFVFAAFSILFITLSGAEITVGTSEDLTNETKAEMVENDFFEQIYSGNFDREPGFTTEKGTFAKAIPMLSTIFVSFYTVSSPHYSFFALPLSYLSPKAGLFTLTPTILYSRVSDVHKIGMGDLKLSYTSPMIKSLIKAGLYTVMPVNSYETMKDGSLIFYGNNSYTGGVFLLFPFKDFMQLSASFEASLFRTVKSNDYNFSQEPGYAANISSSFLLFRNTIDLYLVPDISFRHMEKLQREDVNDQELVVRSGRGNLFTKIDLVVRYAFFSGGLSVPVYVNRDGESIFALHRSFFFFLKASL